MPNLKQRVSRLEKVLIPAAEYFLALPGQPGRNKDGLTPADAERLKVSANPVLYRIRVRKWQGGQGA